MTFYLSLFLAVIVAIAFSKSQNSVFGRFKKTAQIGSVVVWGLVTCIAIFEFGYQNGHDVASRDIRNGNTVEQSYK